MEWAQALFVVPWYEAARLLNAVLPGIPAGARNIFFDAVITSSSATFAAIAVTLLLLIFLRMHISTSVAVASALMVGWLHHCLDIPHGFFRSHWPAACYWARRCG